MSSARKGTNASLKAPHTHTRQCEQEGLLNLFADENAWCKL